MTKTQIVTIVLIIAYIIWEIAVRMDWAKTQATMAAKGGSAGALMRVDLIIIYPILIILIIISLYQYFK